MLLPCRSLTYFILGLLRYRCKKNNVKYKVWYEWNIYSLTNTTHSMREWNALQVKQTQWKEYIEDFSMSKFECVLYRHNLHSWIMCPRKIYSVSKHSFLWFLFFFFLPKMLSYQNFSRDNSSCLVYGWAWIKLCWLLK